MNKIIIILLALLATNSFAALPDSVTNDINSQLEKFKTLLEFSYVYHKDSIDLEDKSEAALKAYMQALDDKSYYFPEEQYRSLKESNTGIRKSLGITQIVFADTSYIFRVDKGSSADTNGVMPGWRILSIDDINVIKKDELSINEIINDTALVACNIEFLDLEGKIQNRVLHNSPHVTSSIDASFMYNDSIAYIKTLKFTEDAGNEFEKVIGQFPKSIKGLVIDLENNPGGVLTAIADVISLFLPEGKQVIKTKSKHPDFYYDVKSKKDGPYIGLPLVLIVNEETASASELFAGAVQDYDLGIVIGQRTYGKGTLQKHWEFKDGSAFRVTVGEYVTPLGRKVQKESVKAFDNSAQTLDENLNNQLKNMSIPKDISVVKSTKGRTLISIGGIMPDSVLNKREARTKLTEVAIQKRVLLRTAFEIFISEGKSVLNMYPDFLSFSRDFFFNSTISERIKKNLLIASLQNDEMFEKDKEIMIGIIKARLGQLLFSDEAYYCTEAFESEEVSKAIITIKDANNLVRQE
ncbi:MAG: S41 family peptidase [Candidatus Kapaibacterium sp.]